MRHLLFAALICGGMATTSAAQQVPARDLLDFPIGSFAEPAALSTRLPSGLWNPAAVTLGPTAQMVLGVGALNSPIEQGVAAQLATASIRVRHQAVVTASVVRANVTDLVRTETDPQSVGSEIPYNTTVYSLGVSRQFGSLAAGFAGRVRTGTADYIQRSAFSLDAGVVADRVLGSPVRLAASTFLLSPTRSRERPTLTGAADVPVYRRDSTMQVRGGLAYSMTDGRGSERYVFGAWRYLGLEARAGVAQLNEFGATSNHLRLGMDMQYARYAVGIAREQEGAGLGAVYQFMLSAVFP
jgi:hypothetical protein